jgi:hypothetical protein
MMAGPFWVAPSDRMHSSPAFEGRQSLLFAGEPLPRGLPRHVQGCPDRCPRRTELPCPSDKTGEVALYLSAGCRHPREARKDTVEIKRFFPGSHRR